MSSNVDGVINNLKTKKTINHEYRNYERITKITTEFVIKHKNTPQGLMRYNITPLSVADVFLLIRDFNYDFFVEALIHVNWFEFKYLHLYQKGHQLNHNCCVSCRLILAEFGLFFHKLILRCRKFVSLISPIFEFVLTADNVDLNGVLDFEDYTPIAKRKTNDILINDIMAPLYHIFFSMYNHVGCYFITSPIYERFTNDLLADFEHAIYNVTPSTLRPSFLQYYSFMHFDTYLPDNLSPDIARPINHWSTFDIPDTAPEHHIHIFPITRDYHNVYDVPTSINGSDIYIKTTAAQYPDIIDLLDEFAANNTVYVYIYDHECRQRYIKHLLHNVVLFWVHSLYDANVNLSHFKLIHNIDIDPLVSYPIIGETTSTDIVDCPNCNVDMAKRIYVSMGRPHYCKRFLQSIRDNRVNPLLIFDERILHLGDLVKRQPYTKVLNNSTNLYTDEELLLFLKEHGCNVIFDRFGPAPSHNLERTIVSNYFLPIAQENGLMDDFELFNQNRSGSISLNTLLMSFEIVFNLSTNEIRNSNGVLNRPTPIELVPVRKPHKSSGTPYFTRGDAETYREVVGEERSAVLNHNRHSLNTGLTYVIPKYALASKSRVRTILAINMPTSEAGRHLFRHNLDKIKASSTNSGPILIGFSSQRLGWHKVIHQLYDKHNITDETYLAVNDFPKFDRNVDNNLQVLSHLLLFSANDPLSVEYKLSEIYLEVFGQFADNTFDYVIIDGKLVVKPGGVTSGNPCTADGNSYIYYLPMPLFSLNFLSLTNLANIIKSEMPLPMLNSLHHVIISSLLCLLPMVLIISVWHISHLICLLFLYLVMMAWSYLLMMF